MVFMTDAEQRWDALVAGAKAMGSDIMRNPTGKHTIPGLSLADADQKTLYDINYLIPILRELYPDFTFWKSETLFDNAGLTINWKFTPGMSAQEAINSIRVDKHREALESEAEQERLMLEDGMDGQERQAARRETEGSSSPDN
jgi:hypothetical protein